PDGPDTATGPSFKLPDGPDVATGPSFKLPDGPDTATGPSFKLPDGPDVAGLRFRLSVAVGGMSVVCRRTLALSSP
ncbi:hypothetical protein ACFWOB_24410, partial [Streptomyces sp. NPDC058420]|uniref:hypothetical protein n=1 Tax=Streptomyces sp. NPDC058420 TaxID=3346489 RepID=UPI003658AF25